MDSRSGALVEMYHDNGYDAIMIVREHTVLNSETILEHIRLARALGIPCMVRAAGSSYHEIDSILDWVGDGVFVPRTSPTGVALRARTSKLVDPSGYEDSGALS